jgi:hypothetical protein
MYVDLIRRGIFGLFSYQGGLCMAYRGIYRARVMNVATCLYKIDLNYMGF